MRNENMSTRGVQTNNTCTECGKQIVGMGVQVTYQGETVYYHFTCYLQTIAQKNEKE